MSLFAAIIAKALQLFLVLDPLGNFGIIATLISGFSKDQQRRILIRELFLALLILLFMYFAGGYLLNALGISHAAITITGGIIFFLFALSLLFPESGVMNLKNLDEEPFLVPIATPLIVGPSSTATVIVLSHDFSLWGSLAAIGLAWALTAVIILSGPALLLRLGKTGMQVMERIIGMVCTLIAVKMIAQGLKLFFKQF